MHCSCLVSELDLCAVHNHFSSLKPKGSREDLGTEANILLSLSAGQNKYMYNVCPTFMIYRNLFFR